VKRLLLVSQRPQEYGGGGSTRWNYFRSELPSHGWEVEVVTARANPTANEFSTNPTHARLNAVRAATMGRVGAVMRPATRKLAGIQPEALAPSALWAYSGRSALRAAIERHRPDVVVATSPPVASHLLLGRLAGEVPVPLVFEMRDNWAGNPYYDAGGTLLQRVESRALHSAAAVVVVTPAMADVVARLHPELASRTHVLENGFDPRVLDQRAPRRAATEPIELIHAGSIYGERSPQRLIEAMRMAKVECRLVLAGAGSDDLEPAPDVERLGALAWQDAVRLQADKDIGVVLYSDDSTAQPGKIYELLALGKPILALVAPGNATDQLLRGLGQGAGCVPHDDTAAIAAAIEQLASEPPAAVEPQQLERWNRARITERLAALLDELAA
jgi:glycosyltransferase involved in cell wall biosynthesis